MALAKPAPGLPSDFNPDLLYKISYLRYGAPSFTFTILDRKTSINRVIEAAKQFCKENGYHFVFVEPAFVKLKIGGNDADDSLDP